MLKNEKNTNCKQKPLLLFSPLDWGLGHLTRSIPLLREFQNNDWDIVVACNSTQKAILQSEISGLSYQHLDGYNIRYGRKSLTTKANLALQLIKILTKINVETAFIKQFVHKNRVDAVLSDNCYGFFSPNVPSIFLTHQLNPLTGFGRFADKLLQRFLYRYINRFTECWIPDNEHELTLSGKLSHGIKLPEVPVTYLGALSRLNSRTQKRSENEEKYKYDLLIVLSGPEPQRTILENLIVQEISADSPANEKYINRPAGETDITGLSNEKNDPGLTNEKHISGLANEKDINWPPTEKNFDHPTNEKNVPELSSQKHIPALTKTYVIIRGLPGTTCSSLPGFAEQYCHVTASQLETLAIQSRFVLCRSGYTSIMDMLKLEKKMILVPTPGQTEQEYLADHLMKNNIAVAIRQKNFSLKESIARAELFSYEMPKLDMNLYKEVIRNFTQSCKSCKSC